MDDWLDSDLASEKEPTPFLIISLMGMELNEGLDLKLLKTLEARYEVLKAKTLDQALEHLSAPELKSVLIADGRIGDFKYKLLRDCLVEFVKEGGTVVHACAFSSFITPPAFNRYFKHGWGLPWKFGKYGREEFYLGDSGGHGINRKKLVKSYSLRTVAVEDVAVKDALYFKGDCSVPLTGASCESPVVFRKIEAGFMGYVGDVNHEEGSYRIVLAMFGLN